LFTVIDVTDSGREAAHMVDDLVVLLQPVVSEADLELVDVELRSGVLLVTVDRPGGVDLQALTDANRVVSAVLDEHDPIPGRYTLEVSSPGVERTLRTPAHFTKAIGETVSIKTRPQVPGDRRLRGQVAAADDRGFMLAVDGEEGEPRRLAYTDIDRARTVFVWGPEARRNGNGSPSTRTSTPAKPKSTDKKPKSTDKRKQVVTP
jgi:ribosome maturation factor RimP